MPSDENARVHGLRTRVDDRVEAINHRIRDPIQKAKTGSRFEFIFTSKADENLLLVPRLGPWSDVTPDGYDFLDRIPKDELDFGFLFIDRGVAVPRNQDDSM